MAAPAVGGDAAAALAVDAGALDALKRTARDDPKRALSAAATQFEALFVQMLLKTMREALPQDGLFASDSSKMYTSMFDQQVAQQMSARGIGLKQMLERQLAPALQGAAPADGTHAQGRTIDTPATMTPAGAPGAAQHERHPFRPFEASARIAHARAVAARSGAAAAATKDVAGGATGAATHVPANVARFIETMRPHAEAAARAVGVPAELLLAQAGLETGWGRAQPKAADGATSHNLFGIKAGRGWSGSVAMASTTEYVAGAVVRTVDRFRSYRSYTEAFQDFGRLITGNARYAAAVRGASDPATYARGLQQGGYATDPHYADKLMRAVQLVSAHAQGVQAAGAQVAAPRAVNPSRTTEA